MPSAVSDALSKLNLDEPLSIEFSEKASFCRLHDLELVYKPLAEKLSIPEEIHFDEIGERITRFGHELEDVIYGRMPSEYQRIVHQAYQHDGRGNAKNAMVVWSSFEELLVSLVKAFCSFCELHYNVFSILAWLLRTEGHKVYSPGLS